MIQNLLRLVIIFCLISCVDIGKDQIYKDYIQSFENIKINITDHFPKEYKSIINDYSYSVDTVAYFNTQEFNLSIYDETNTQIQLLRERYSDRIFSLDTECIIVVNDFLSKNTLLIEKEDLNNYTSKFSEKCDDYKIIPNFWNNIHSDETTRSRLNKDFKYIILDSDIGKGVYSNKLDPNISYMPNFALHGYSKGIAFNEKENTIIYWLIFW